MDGADGLWYAASDGASYAGDAIPANKADTYYSVAPSKFAVYSDADKSLDFYNRAGRPFVGDVWQGKSVEGVYTGLENTAFAHNSNADVTDRVPCQSWAQYAKTVKSVEVVDGGIKPKSMSYWFYCFSSMSSCDVRKLDTSDCEYMDCAWLYCLAMHSIDVSNFDLSKCWSLSCAFDATGLYSIDVSNWNVENVHYLNTVFAFSPNLSTIEGLDNWNPKSAETLGGIFMCSPKLTDLSAVKAWDVSSCSSFFHMFNGLPDLQLDLSAWNVRADADHEYFNTNSPGVILPAVWQASAQQSESEEVAAFAADDSGASAGLGNEGESASGDPEEEAGARVEDAVGGAGEEDTEDARDEDTERVG